MCNCGKKRSQLTQQPTIRNANNVQPSQAPVYIQTKQSVMFEYTGKTALSVVGSITRKSYRFQFAGDKQYVDINDASGMMAIPVLKK